MSLAHPRQILPQSNKWPPGFFCSSNFAFSPPPIVSNCARAGSLVPGRFETPAPIAPAGGLAQIHELHQYCTRSALFALWLVLACPTRFNRLETTAPIAPAGGQYLHIALILHRIWQRHYLHYTHLNLSIYISLACCTRFNRLETPVPIAPAGVLYLQIAPTPTLFTLSRWRRSFAGNLRHRLDELVDKMTILVRIHNTPGWTQEDLKQWHKEQ